MERKALYFLVVASILAAFAFGVLLSQNAHAQIGDSSRVSHFPRQSELWSFSANGDVTRDPTTGGHVFTIQADTYGRLPVLTTIHARATHDAGFNLLYRDVEGQWQAWEISDDSLAPAKQETRFHQAIGVVLRPGRYMITGYTERPYELMLSGYWANP